MAWRRRGRETRAVTKTLALTFLTALLLTAPASAASPPATGKTMSAALLGKTLQP